MTRSPRKGIGPATHEAREQIGLTGFDDEDSNGVRWAFFIAVALHALLFSLNLPGMSVRAEPPERKQVFVLHVDRFKPQPPDRQEVIPQQLPRKVPIPGPTPEGPELVGPPAEIEVPVALPDSDVVSGIPDAPPEPEAETPLRVGGEVEPPVRIYSPPPRYSELARRARIQGRVIVEAIIDENGAVTSTRILKALPMGLDRAAVEAVTRWRFEPATLRGRPVAVFYYLTVKFELS